MPKRFPRDWTREEAGTFPGHLQSLAARALEVDQLDRVPSFRQGNLPQAQQRSYSMPNMALLLAASFDCASLTVTRSS
jgi:hypothetical protein